MTRAWKIHVLNPLSDILGRIKLSDIFLGFKKQFKKKTQLKYILLLNEKLYKVISYVNKYTLYTKVFSLHTWNTVILLLYINRKTRSVLPNNKSLSTHPFVVQFMNNFPLSNTQHTTTSTITTTQRFNLRETWRSRGAWRNKPGFWGFLWRFCYLYSSVYRTPDSVPSCRLISGKSPDDESFL